MPIDISRSHLMAAAQALSQRYPHIDVQPVCADFTRPLWLPPQENTLVFFPGSTIGNFERRGLSSL